MVKITHGMDTGAVREVARELKARSTALRTVCTDVDGLVAMAGRIWKGPDSSQFADKWRNSTRRLLQDLANQLDELAKTAVRNADAQEQVSNTLGAAEIRSGRPSNDDEKESQLWLQSLPRTKETREDSLRLVNPNYDDLSQKFQTLISGMNPLKFVGLHVSTGEWRNNCGYTSIAYDMRRRGFDVTAQADFDGSSDDHLASAYVDPDTGKPREFIKTGTKKATIQMMQDYGAGSRAMVILDWKHGGRHAFIVENVEGKVLFVDPQNSSDKAADYFSRAKDGGVSILRLDDQIPAKNPMKKQMVEVRDEIPGGGSSW